MLNINFTKFVKDDLTVYKSKYSGIKLAFGNEFNDIISSRINIGINNEFEVAHAIEHLVFCKSKNYSQSLFTLASFYYGLVTGYTSPNLTTYNLDTLNEDGFIKVLPALLDAIFNPTLTESLYKANVYHIDGKGKKSGRLYHELRHKKISSLDYLLRGKNGLNFDNYYSSELDSIADFETVKRYHKKYYRMDNCVLTIKGRINHERVLETIEQFEIQNRFERLTTPIPDNSLNFLPFNNEIRRVDVPHELGDCNILWKKDTITVKEYYELSVILSYLKEIINTRNDLSFQITTVSRFKPLCYGIHFNYAYPEEFTELYFEDITKTILNIILNTEINVNTILNTINEKMNVQEDIFEKMETYQLFSTTEDDEFADYLDRYEYEELSYKDEYYWKELISRFFMVEYVTIVKYPTPNMDKIQRNIAIKRSKDKKKMIGVEEFKKQQQELESSIMLNKKICKDSNNLDNLEDIKVQFSNIERTFYKEDKNTLSIPIKYYIDESVENDHVTYELNCYTDKIREEYYDLLPLLIHLKSKVIEYYNREDAEKKMTKLNYNMSTIENILTIKVTSHINKSEVIGYIFDNRLTTIQDPKISLKNTLKGMLSISDITRTYNINQLEKLVDNSVLKCEARTAPYHVSVSNNYQLYKEMLKSIDDEAYFKNLIDKLNELNSEIRNANLWLNIYIRNPDIIENIKFRYWPECENQTKNNVNEYSLLTGKKFCIYTPEWYPVYLNRYTPVKDVDEKHHHYILLLNTYLGGYILGQSFVTGTSYCVFFRFNKRYGLIFSVYGTNDLYDTGKSYKNLIVDTISKKNVDPSAFELAKRKTIYQSSTKKQSFYNLFKDLTFEEVIDTVGQMYLDLFDDEKSTEVIMLPRSMDDEMEKYKNFEIKTLKDVMNDFSSLKSISKEQKEEDLKTETKLITESDERGMSAMDYNI